MEMLKFAEQVTRMAHQTAEEDIVRLRSHDFGDEAILSIVQITGFFNYINRVADALGVEVEDFMVQG